MPCHPFKDLARLCFAGITGLLLQACHVRTPEFHCKQIGAPTENMELSMSPLEIRFASRRFVFVEERGNQRLYRETTQGKALLFDLSSMQLSEYESLASEKRANGDPFTGKDKGRQTGAQPALVFQIQAPLAKQWACERYKML